MVVVHVFLQWGGSVASRCANRARSAGQRASVARSRACSGSRSGAERAARACLLVFLRGTRVLVGAGVECASPLSLQHCGVAALQAAAAGAQLYFPREDVSFLFVDTLRSTGRWVLSTHACLHRSLDHPEGVKSSAVRCHANSKDQARSHQRYKSS